MPTVAYMDERLTRIEERLLGRVDELADRVGALEARFEGIRDDVTVLEIEKRLHGRIESLERRMAREENDPSPPAGLFHMIEDDRRRLAELAGRVQALETPDARPGYSSCQATRYVTVTEEKWQLIEQVLEAAFEWRDGKKDFDRNHILSSARPLWDAVDAYRKVKQ